MRYRGVCPIGHKVNAKITVGSDEDEVAEWPHWFSMTCPKCFGESVTVHVSPKYLESLGQPLRGSSPANLHAEVSVETPAMTFSLETVNGWTTYAVHHDGTIEEV